MEPEYHRRRIFFLYLRDTGTQIQIDLPALEFEFAILVIKPLFPGHKHYQVVAHLPGAASHKIIDRDAVMPYFVNYIYNIFHTTSGLFSIFFIPTTDIAIGRLTSR